MVIQSLRLSKTLNSNLTLTLSGGRLWTVVGKCLLLFSLFVGHIVGQVRFVNCQWPPCAFTVCFGLSLLTLRNFHVG